MMHLQSDRAMQYRTKITPPNEYAVYLRLFISNGSGL